MANQKILIIDDVRADRESIAHVLTTELGIAKELLLFAPDGDTAIDIIRREKPYVAVLDTVFEGDIEGYNICRRIKEVDRSVHVVMTTGMVAAVDQKSAREAGADNYCAKSPPYLTMVRILRTFLE